MTFHVYAEPTGVSTRWSIYAVRHVTHAPTQTIPATISVISTRTDAPRNIGSGSKVVWLVGRPQGIAPTV